MQYHQGLSIGTNDLHMHLSGIAYQLADGSDYGQSTKAYKTSYESKYEQKTKIASYIIA